MPLQASNLADLLTTTLENVEKVKFTDLSGELNDYPTTRDLMKKQRIRTYSSGTDFEYDAMLDSNPSARHVGLYAEDQLAAVEVMGRAKVPFRHTTWNWIIDEHEITMNSPPLQIVNLALTRRLASAVGFVKLAEKTMWRCPAASDQVSPRGYPYWIVKNATEGFTGTLPSGYTDVGNMVPSAILGSDGVSKWANWAGLYAEITIDDLIRKMITASNRTQFSTPVPDMPTLDTGTEKKYCTTYTVRARMTEILRRQNDDLGPDVAYGENTLIFMQRPVEWVPQLDEDTTNPIYGLNVSTFFVGILSGWWFKEWQEQHLSRAHNVAASYFDCTWNPACYNRRKNFVLATGTTMPA